MRLLVTAFDPFGGESVNPALEAVRRLPAEIAGAAVVTHDEDIQLVAGQTH